MAIIKVLDTYYTINKLLWLHPFALILIWCLRAPTSLYQLWLVLYKSTLFLFQNDWLTTSSSLNSTEIILKEHRWRDSSVPVVRTLLENGHQRIRDSSGIGGRGNPFQYSCLENPHGQRSLVGYSQWGRMGRTLLSDSAKNTAHQVDGIELTFRSVWSTLGYSLWTVIREGSCSIQETLKELVVGRLEGPSGRRNRNAPTQSHTLSIFGSSSFHL